jgi:hypothetical protein
LCNRPPERVGLNVIGEPAATVDLHNGQPLPVFGLEDGVTGDVDLAQVEAELLPELGDHASSLLAEMAARGVVDDDVGYG